MKKMIRLLALVLVLALSVCTLASCAPAADPDKALASLKENGYTAAKDDTVVPAALKAAFIVAGVKATVDEVVSGTYIGEDDEVQTVTIVYFTDKDGAKAAWDEVKEYAEDQKKDDEAKDWTIAKSGNMIYWGTKAGIAAAR